MVVGIFFVIKANFHSSIRVSQHNNSYLIQLKKDVNFLNKNELTKTLNNIPENADVIIDGRNAEFIDADIYEVIEDFKTAAYYKNINLELKRLRSTPNELFPTNNNLKTTKKTDAL